MAHQIVELPNARTQVRCIPGDIVHVAFDAYLDRWTVEEDPQQIRYQNKSDALYRARVIGKDPDVLG
jgi:hypothetical protein